VDLATLAMSLGLVAFASYLIKFACDQFEPAADYLGRNMPPGVKGATINAIGSSMPELLTSIAFIFTVSKLSVSEGMMAAVAATAGSAIFNIVIIPALVILTAVWVKKQTDFVSVSKSTIIRDGFFLLLAEFILISILTGSIVITWQTGLLLIFTYGLYIMYLFWQMSMHKVEEEEEEEDDDDDDVPVPGVITQILTLDFINLFYRGRVMNESMAWAVLGFSVLVLGIACHLLAEGVVLASEALSVPLFITSLLLAAAATSVPDTILSIKDAAKGNYDDAVANAVGSNIFDITICAGLPFLLYTLMHGPVIISMDSVDGDQIQVLRIVLFVISAAIISLFLFGKRIGVGKALAMLGLYAAWAGWIIYLAIGG
jgi:cation:H+ antiporter